METFIDSMLYSELEYAKMEYIRNEQKVRKTDHWNRMDHGLKQDVLCS